MVEQTFSTTVDYINRYSDAPWHLELFDNNGCMIASSKFKTKTEAKEIERYWNQRVGLGWIPDDYGNWDYIG